MSAAARIGLRSTVLAAAGAAASPNPPAIVPRPAQVQVHPGQFSLTADTVLVGTGEAAGQAVTAFGVFLAASGGPTLAHAPAHSGAGVIRFALRDAQPGGAESYRLSVTPQRVLVTAPDAAGLFYGAVTLWQLATAPEAGGKIPALEIADAPRFPWRGLMLDSARHLQSVDFILRSIDWMALHKLNVLSWHLTDDQGWRLEIRRYPRLTSVGAWRVEAGSGPQHDIDPATGAPRRYGGFYTQAEVRRIVTHAAARHVTVVPEIDLPGHSSAAIVAYPELGVLEHPPTVVPADWGIYPNLLNVEEGTFEFFEHVLDEVMELFPSHIINLGGDEAVKDQWRSSPRIQARMRDLQVKDEVALQGYFTARLGAYLRAHGRQLAGWDEILEGGVPPDALVMSWRGVQGAISAAAAGHDTVLSPDPALYLDNRQGDSPGEPPGRQRPLRLADVYHFDPLPGPLAQDRAHVRGVQANLWTEHVRTDARAAYMTWPRAAALAEVAWSPPAQDYPDFERRLTTLLPRYRQLGIAYSADAFDAQHAPAADEPQDSAHLKSCSAELGLALEDDAPIVGPRAVFVVDIMNPCWIFPAVDLTGGPSFSAAVGQVPFNFQLGADIDKIHLEAPATAGGELKVRLDSCEGETLAALPLAPALANDAVTTLPTVRLPARAGRHDLCLRFAQRGLDPLWVIDWVQVRP